MRFYERSAKGNPSQALTNTFVGKLRRTTLQIQNTLVDTNVPIIFNPNSYTFASA
jgi:hypothetical protein